MDEPLAPSYKPCWLTPENELGRPALSFGSSHTLPGVATAAKDCRYLQATVSYLGDGTIPAVT